MDSTSRRNVRSASLAPVLLSALLAAPMHTETVDFLLQLDGGLAPGVERPPPQRLRVPAQWLDPNRPKPNRETGAVEARAFSLDVPFDGAAFANQTDAPVRRKTIRVSVGITAANWPERTRHFTDPAQGAMPGYLKQPGPGGLVALVPEDRRKHDNPFERVYLAEDETLGFVHVKCLGIPERGPRMCRVTTGFSAYLTMSVHVPEPDLIHWRVLTLAARDLVKSLLV